MKSFKRVLVLSHNAFSKTENNGKTLEAFFKKWDKKLLAQIYLQPEEPDFDFCNNYFRITDYDILNNIFSKEPVGEEVANNKINKEKMNYNPIVSKLYTDRRNGNERKNLNRMIHKAFIARRPMFLAAREMLWKMSNWKSQKLIEWIKKFSPDVLFFQGSNGVFGYEIALWICDTFKIPLVLQLTDDYTVPLYNYSLVERINKAKYRKIFKKTISLSKTVITISDEMSKEYSKIIEGHYVVLMNTVERKTEVNEPSGMRLLFGGNVSLNRWRVLKNIGKALDLINDIENTNYKLDIYTPTNLSNDVIKEFNAISSIHLGGSLNQKELSEQIKASNLLLHVESFDKKMRKITRLSISTKIPEYMASKRCIFAVGPEDVASIKYLKNQNYGIVVNSDNVEIIKKELQSIIENPNKRFEIILNAYEGYKSKHHPEIVQKKIFEVIENAC